MLVKKKRFQGSRGDELAGQLDMPDSESPSSYALFAHCFTCTKNLKAVSNLNLELTRADVGVFRFDFTGLGESEGDFSEADFASNVEDLVAAADFLKLEYAAPSLLIGHSLGGAAVIQAAEKIPSCRAVVVIAAPYELTGLNNMMRSARSEIDEKGTAVVEISGRKFNITKKFYDDLDKVNMKKNISGLKRALLILHSPGDAVVDIRNAAEIFQAARHPKSFISLDTADHLLMREPDSRYAGTVIAAWAERYIKK